MCATRFGKYGWTDCWLFVVGKSPPHNVHRRRISSSLSHVKGHDPWHTGFNWHWLRPREQEWPSKTHVNITMELTAWLLSIPLLPDEADGQPLTNSPVPHHPSTRCTTIAIGRDFLVPLFSQAGLGFLPCCFTCTTCRTRANEWKGQQAVYLNDLWKSLSDWRVVHLMWRLESLCDCVLQASYYYSTLTISFEGKLHVQLFSFIHHKYFLHILKDTTFSTTIVWRCWSDLT